MDFVVARRVVRGAEFESFVRDVVCAGPERQRILRCLAETLELEALGGKAEANLAAYRLWRALSERATWEDIPFIRALARRSIKEIRGARRF